MPKDNKAEYEREANIRSRIREELNKAGAAESLGRLEADKHSRHIRKSNPAVLTCDLEGDSRTLLPPPGSVALFFAKKHSDLLRELEYSYVANDLERLRSLEETIEQDLESRPVITLEQAVSKFIEGPSYFDFSYGSRTLASNLGLTNGVDFGSLVLAYNGGKLNAQDFTIVEYNKRDTQEYDFLVVKRQPILTDFETKALEAVPPNLLEHNIASSGFGPVGIWPAVIIKVVLVTIAGTLCFQLDGDLAKISLSAREIESLGSAATARELLNLRREVFAKDRG